MHVEDDSTNYIDIGPVNKVRDRHERRCVCVSEWFALSKITTIDTTVDESRCDAGPIRQEFRVCREAFRPHERLSVAGFA